MTLSEKATIDKTVQSGLNIFYRIRSFDKFAFILFSIEYVDVTTYFIHIFLL